MTTEAEQQELEEFQANLKIKLRYLGSFFSIALIVIGLYLLLNGMLALVTRPANLNSDDKETAIFDTQNPITTPVVSLTSLPGIAGVVTDSTMIGDLNNNNKNEGGIINGIDTEKVSAASLNAEEKSRETISIIRHTGRWQATDYVQGDIGIGVYEVKQGDTLWEIAEAVYGNGKQWGKILERNSAKIGRLPNGSQALIFPGQKLEIIK